MLFNAYTSSRIGLYPARFRRQIFLKLWKPFTVTIDHLSHFEFNFIFLQLKVWQRITAKSELHRFLSPILEEEVFCLTLIQIETFFLVSQEELMHIKRLFSLIFPKFGRSLYVKVDIIIALNAYQVVSSRSRFQLSIAFFCMMLKKVWFCSLNSYFNP